MYYTIYEVTNKLNGKIYIGKHQTENLEDGYLGSGTAINAAIRKHGRDNFTKRILFNFDNEVEMIGKEVELVTAEFVKLDSNYNIAVGGYGGGEHLKGKTLTEEHRQSLRAARSRPNVKRADIENGRKNGKASLGRKLTGKALANITMANKTRVYNHSAESNEKRRLASTGKTLSAEARAKIAAVQRKRWERYRLEKIAVPSVSTTLSQ